MADPPVSTDEGRDVAAALRRMPGFLPGDSAISPGTNKRTALERMEEYRSSILPVVDPGRGFVGVVDRTRLVAGLILDFTASLESSNVKDYGLDGEVLPCPEERTLDLANTATRLKRLPKDRQERLISWGYAVCDTAIRTHCQYLFPQEIGIGQFPYTQGV